MTFRVLTLSSISLMQLFVMNTSNDYPQWHNQPLRLTISEIENPSTVIDEFFETCHLPDIRLCMDNWMHDGMVAETIESKAHVYTHDKVIKLIEACWVLRQNQKRTAHKDSSITIPISGPEEVLGKPIHLVELAERNPTSVIAEVFDSESLPSLRDQLRDWMHVGLSADCSIYEEGEQRRQLLAFQDQLLVLVEALFIIDKDGEIINTDRRISEEDKPKLLNQDQIVNPKQVIAAFFDKFPIVYSIRELNDWLEAGIAYAGEYPDNMSELQVLYTYRNVLCLIKAANQLLIL
jgi:hypothetical protein